MVMGFGGEVGSFPWRKGWGRYVEEISHTVASGSAGAEQRPEEKAAPIRRISTLFYSNGTGSAEERGLKSTDCEYRQIIPVLTLLSCVVQGSTWRFSFLTCKIPAMVTSLTCS